MMLFLLARVDWKVRDYPVLFVENNSYEFFYLGEKNRRNYNVLVSSVRVVVLLSREI